MAIWISDSNAVRGTAKRAIKDCCKRKINRVLLRNQENGTSINICKVCGSKHYGLEADTFNLGLFG